MKILFTASQRGKKTYEKQYEMIASEIKRLGYDQLQDDLLHISSESFYKDIEEGGREANVKFYKQKMRSLQEADICIFECSAHSLSMGFLIQKALDFNKPTIVLYHKDNITYFLTGIQDEKLIVKSYNESNITSILKEVITEAQEVRDKRFNFFINPRLLAYLEQTSKQLGITKSTFIRNLILEHMKKHK